ncbi:E6 [Gammapapillomavirus 22]|uniref:Protein E6 n=1 Tax=Gammapapillomavirus 22 TaxID=1961679 RepID=A0A2D2ALY9_9PAPI|nr:E6 [Gammapapillomavirus 22]
MAGVHPTSLDEYCKTFEISFFELKLSCLFCKHELSLQDLAGFATKILSLVWREDKCFGCCSMCLRLSAKFEREKYTQCEVQGYMLENLLNVPLSDVLVRCLYCFRRLDYIEKVDCCAANLPFSLIRSHWRNCCRLCRVEDERSRN